MQGASVITAELPRLAQFHVEVLKGPNLPAKLRVRISPSDPDFPFDLRYLSLDIFVPQSYPNELPIFRVSDKSIPPSIRMQIEKAILKRSNVYRGRLMLRGLCVWVDRNLTRLLVEKVKSESVVEPVSGNSEVARTEEQPVVHENVVSTSTTTKTVESVGGISFVTFKRKEEAEEEIVVEKQSSEEVEPQMLYKKDADDPEDVFGFSGLLHEERKNIPNLVVAPAVEKMVKKKELFAEDERSRPNAASHTAGAEEDVPVSKDEKITATVAGAAFVIGVASLRLTNVAILELKSASVVVLCQRCRIQIGMMIHEGVTAHECVRCHVTLHTQLQIEAIHENNHVAARLVLSGCVLIDVSRAEWNSLCVECAAPCIFRGLPGFATPSCRQCFTKLGAEMGPFTLERLIKEIEMKVSVTPKGSKKKLITDGIVSGQPLPEQGTCKHYLKSKRWMRFPCCHRAFPCDQCHDAQSDHHCEWALKMICGYCAREQKLADECVYCGKSVTATRSAKGLFWEGGKGCRDPQLLSRHDSKKQHLLAKQQQEVEARTGTKAPKKRERKGRGNAAPGAGSR